MKILLTWMQRRIGSLLIVAGIVIVILVFRELTSLPPSATENALVVEATVTTTTDSPLPTPAVTGTEPPAPTPSATWAEPPTPTLPPIPTQLPTPVVTPIPLAQPPIIPAPSEPQTYTILYKEGNVIFAVDNHGENQRQIVDVYAETSLYLPLESAIWAAPAPNGRQLALVLSTLPEPSPRRGDPPPQYSIYLFDFVTNKLQLLLQDSVSPVWSPDGTKIAYNHLNGLWVVEVSTGATQEIYRIEAQSDRFVTDVSWAPDSKRLVFSDQVFRQSSSLMLLDLAALNAPITLLPDYSVMTFAPLWSPDGSKILFTALAKGTLLADRDFYSLWLADPTGKELTQLTDSMFVSGSQAWSPDGQWIAFTAAAAYETSETYHDLWVANTQGEIKRLTALASAKANATSVDWSPDGSQLVYTIDRKDAWIIDLVTGEGVKQSMDAASVIILP